MAIEVLVGCGKARTASLATDALPSSAHPTKPFKPYEEWVITSEADGRWPGETNIAAKADFEYLYDKPYEDKKKVRVVLYTNHLGDEVMKVLRV